MRVVRWGNSLAVRFPAALVERMNLSAGAQVALRAMPNDLSFVAEQPAGFGEERNNPVVPDSAQTDDDLEDKAYTVTIGKWGNSLAIRLPREIVSSLGLSEGDEVIVLVGADMLVITKEPSVDELFDRVRSLRGLIPADYKFDREEANARVPYERG